MIPCSHCGGSVVHIWDDFQCINCGRIPTSQSSPELLQSSLQVPQSSPQAKNAAEIGTRQIQREEIQAATHNVLVAQPETAREWRYSQAEV